MQQSKQQVSLHGKPYFLFPDALKRWSFQKNCALIWSFAYYRERWYFLFPKIWSDTLDGKWKISFFKNTKIYDIFFKPSEKMVFPKRALPPHDLSCIIWKDGIFFPKKWSIFPGQKIKDSLSQEIHGNMMHLPAKKNRKADI